MVRNFTIEIDGGNATLIVEGQVEYSLHKDEGRDGWMAYYSNEEYAVIERYDFFDFYIEGLVYNGKIKEERVKNLLPKQYKQIFEKINEIDLVHDW